MKPPIRFVLAMVAALALLTWVASGLVDKTTREWFERDVRLRAELAVSGAKQALVGHWRKAERRDLRNLLTELTRDERIMAAAACDSQLNVLATTSGFPAEFSCRKVATHVRPDPLTPAANWSTWHSVAPLPAGSVLVSAVPLVTGNRALGFVVLVHDLSFIERRKTE